MRLIDADALNFTYVEEVGCEGYMHCVVRSLEIKEAPSIDIVRCKECKRLVEVENKKPTCTWTLCSVKPDDFCSYGERDGD